MKVKKISKRECLFNLEEYSELINTIAKVEYKKITVPYLIEYSEVHNIATQTIHTLSEYPEFKYYNSSYLSTAIKWAIRNEIRRRYKWYNAKFKSGLKEKESTESLNLQSAVYSTILSIDEVFSEDGSVAPQIKDSRRTPDEYVEFLELRKILQNAITILPTRERELVEAKFFKEKKLSELSDEFGISASRITRIIQAALAKLKTELERQKLN